MNKRFLRQTEDQLRRIEAWSFRAARYLRRPIAWLMVRGRRGEQVFVLVAAALIGVAAGYVAIGFRELISLCQQLFFSAAELTLAVVAGTPWWRVLLMPAAGGLLVGLIGWRLAPEVKGSGIPEVMEAVAKRVGVIRFRVLLTKTVAAALTIGSGGSAGREGPIVQIGSAIGSAVGQVLQVSAQRLRTFVACGAAAGIAATFNAPIAGALFSMEVVIGDLQVAYLTPIVIAAVLATVVSRHHLGDFPAFRVPEFELVSAQELLLYGVLALVCAGVAVVFIRSLYGTIDLFTKLKVPAWIRPAVGGLAVGALALLLPQILGVGYETADTHLWSGGELPMLVALIAAKIAATSLSLGSGGSGGIFAPSLFLGATTGSAFGEVVRRIFPGWTAPPSAYATVGMGAMVSATTHAPISSILIMFEMTNEYRIIAPLMLSCVIAVLVSRLLHADSIYQAKLRRRGVRLTGGKDISLLRAVRVGDVMRDDPPLVNADLPFTGLVTRLLGSSDPELFVVDGQGRLVGGVALAEIKGSLSEVDALGGLVVAIDVANEHVPFVLPDDNLDLVMHLLGRTHRDELPVCADPESRRVVGVITRELVIEAYNRSIFQFDLTGGFGSLVHAVREGRSVEVLAGVSLTEIDLPAGLAGKTLREADLRNLHDVEVVLIHTCRSDAECLEDRPGKLPTPDTVLNESDKLLVIGTATAIDKLRPGQE